MKYLHVLENAYLALLRLPLLQRLNVQSELCELRNVIAEITDKDIETIQNKFESIVANEIEHTASPDRQGRLV